MHLKWLGHAGFKIGDLLVDPWVERLEAFGMEAPHTWTDIDKDAKVIVVTHGHEDHFVGAFALAKERNMTVMGTGESIGPAMAMGVKSEMMNMGGPVEAHGWKVTLVPAWHTGNATGAILQKDGKTIYHTGDTCIFGDMKLIGEMYHPDVVLLPIGGRFTMDITQAVLAAKMIGAKLVIPMHYNTFPMVQADAQAFKKQVESTTGSKVKVLAIGEETTI